MHTRIAALLVLLLTALSAGTASAAPLEYHPPTTTLTTDALEAPTRVAVDSNGTLYIADTLNNRIQKITFDNNGNPTATTIAGGTQGNGPNQLNYPHGVAVDSNNNLYIADTNNNRIQKITFNNNGNPTTTTIAGGTHGNGPNQLSVPYDIAVDSNGTLYIADTNNNRIQKITFNNNGNPTATTIAGGTHGDGPNQLNYPHGVAVDSNNNLYIADTNNNRIQKITFNNNGNPTATTIAGGTHGDGPNQLNQPRGVAVDDNDTLYIADSFNNRIQKTTFNNNGNPTTTTITGGSGNGPNQLSAPFDIAVDSNGTLYIADSFNNRIQKITFNDNGNPTATTIAGGTQGNGPNQLSVPYGVAVDDNGTLYIADTDNDRIQKTTLDTKAPTINTTNRTLKVGATATVTYTCDDTGSGINSCTATLNGQPATNGDPAPTTTRGTHTLTITATDQAGNVMTETTTITIIGKRELTGNYRNADGPAGSIARLYMATFKRAPEGEGFTFWQTSHSNGMTLQKMADHFVTSTEFTSLYGNTTNTEFVDLMYLNVMDRTADTDGQAFWLGQLDGGMTQARMLLMLSESSEFKGLTYTS